MVIADSPLESFFSCWGYDSEYELTVDIFPGHIVWLLELDSQWTEPPRRVEQSHLDFFLNGAPRCCAWGAGGELLADITRFLEGLQDSARPEPS